MNRLARHHLPCGTIENLEMRRGQMRVECGSVVVYLVEKYMLRLRRIATDVEAAAARFSLARNAGILQHQGHEGRQMLRVNREIDSDYIHGVNLRRGSAGAVQRLVLC